VCFDRLYRLWQVSSGLHGLCMLRAYIHKFTRAYASFRKYTQAYAGPNIDAELYRPRRYAGRSPDMRPASRYLKSPAVHHVQVQDHETVPD
jgi:hypothetical protein